MTELGTPGYETLVFCCGPMGLVEACRETSFALGVDLHTETFEL